MEWQKQLNDFMIIGELENANPPIIAKGALLMDKQKNGELSRMFSYAGNYHVLTILGCVLSGISTILSMLPFVCIWLVIRDLIQAFAAGDIALATESTRYAWMAVVFAAANLFHRFELYPPGGVSYSDQYAENSNSPYCDIAARLFQPKCQWTAAENH